MKQKISKLINRINYKKNFINISKKIKNKGKKMKKGIDKNQIVGYYS